MDGMSASGGSGSCKTKHNDQYVQQDGHYMVFDKGLCEFHARLALPAVCGVRGDDMHGCTVRQMGLTLGNNPVARLEGRKRSQSDPW